MTAAERWAYYRELPQRIADGATLADLYRMLKDEVTPGEQPQITVLAETWTQWPEFVAIRLEELFGGLEVPHDDDYVLAMVGHLGSRREQGIRQYWLRHDSALRDGVFWRIFEVEGGGEVSLANVDKFSAVENTWHQVLLDLVADGTLDREKVLHCCLEALNRDFSAYRVGWFSRLVTALEPSAAEMAAEQDLLRLGLGSAVTATVSFCATQLERVHRAGSLDAAAFVDAAPPALLGAKGTAMRMLRILVKLAASTDRADTAAAIAQATGNAHPDVQRAAVSALQKLGEHALVEQSRAQLSPVVATELLGVGDAAEPVVSAPVAALPEVQPWREWSDQDASERMAMLAEDPADALEVEGALAWLATSERSAEVLRTQARQAGRMGSDSEGYPLARLVLTAVPEEAEKHQRGAGGVIRGVADALRGAVGHRATLLDGLGDSRGVPSVLTRMREVAGILQGTHPRRTLLATPTDSTGTIDPEVFRVRMHEHRAARMKPLPADLVQALLRVPSEDRAGLAAEFGLTVPATTPHIRVDWLSRTYPAQGQAKETTWWYPEVQAEKSERGSETNPGFIPSVPFPNNTRPVNLIEIGQLAIVTPESTRALTAAGLVILYMVSRPYPAVDHRAGTVLRALRCSAGEWTAETAQLVALGMSAKSVEVRAAAVELLAAAVPARVPLATVAEGFAACAPHVVLRRLATSFADAAALAPQLVVDLLGAVLPRLDPGLHDVGALLRALHEEHTRMGSPALPAALGDWLDRFSGASAAARTARALRGSVQPAAPASN